MTTPKAFGRKGAADVRRAPSEGATLVCAVVVAVAFGVACGAWINARLASAASVTAAAPAKLLPSAIATEQKTHASSAVTEYAPAAPDDQSAPPDEAVALTESVNKPSGAESPERVSAGAPGKVEKVGALKRGVGASASAAGEASRSVERAALPGGAPGVGKSAAAGRGGAAPCALYASVGSLTVRGGSAAPLIVGGPGEAGRVSVTTSDWADIAVFNEGRAGGNGWLKYSVRSVSKRPGVYAVRLTTPCGSRTISVTVTRP
ncbi:MAG TPA: hypothetical protein VF588_05305 [Pyrinomonadaceae bacterium]